VSAGISGAAALCETLGALGVDTVFGLPGTQTIWFYEALRTSRLRTVVTTHELAATFMAIGYYRSSGRVAAVSTIPGPGFTYALTGISEARFDSAALLLIVVKPRLSRGNRFRFQDIDQAAVAAPLAKAFVRIETIGELVPRLRHAYVTATAGEPGPVVVEIQAEVLEATIAAETIGRAAAVAPQPLSEPDLTAIRQVLEAGGRRVLLVGQGAAGGAADVVRLAEQLGALVVATSSGRGIVPEDHPCVLPFEYGIHDVRILNDLCRAADAVLVLGCKLGHNGTAGFRLELPEAALVQIDASSEVLAANYPARVAALADVPSAVSQLLAHPAAAAGAWSDQERAQWRDRVTAARTLPNPPVIAGAANGMAEVLAALRAARDGKLAPLEWHDDVALTVVMASQGYPGSYAKGHVITGLDEAAAMPGITIFHAGTERRGGDILAVGGRVLDVTATGRDVAQAQARAYAAVARIHWKGAFCRSDIGWRALARQDG